MAPRPEKAVGSMPGYGFRLYEVKLVEGPGKSKPQPFGCCGMAHDQHVGAWVRRLLERLESHTTLARMPMLRTSEDEALPPISDHLKGGVRGDPAVKFNEHTATPATRLRFELRYGSIGRYDFALDPSGGKALDLTNWAPGHLFRGVFYLPADGIKGVLALETVPSGPHPVDALNSWLARAALEIAEEERLLVESMAPEDASGLTPLPYKLNFRQIPNLARLEKAIKESSTAEVVLRRITIGKDGKPTSEKVRLVSKVETKVERAAAVVWARNAFGRVIKSEQDEPAATLAELEEIVPGDVGGVGFNDGYISLDDGGGKKKIGLEHVDKFFNYPVGSSTQLSATKFEQAVAKEVVSLQGLLGLELDVS